MNSGSSKPCRPTGRSSRVPYVSSWAPISLARRTPSQYELLSLGSFANQATISGMASKPSSGVATRAFVMIRFGSDASSLSSLSLEVIVGAEVRTVGSIVAWTTQES